MAGCCHGTVRISHPQYDDERSSSRKGVGNRITRSARVISKVPGESIGGRTKRCCCGKSNGATLSVAVEPAEVRLQRTLRQTNTHQVTGVRVILGIAGILNEKSNHVSTRNRIGMLYRVQVVEIGCSIAKVPVEYGIRRDTSGRRRVKGHRAPLRTTRQ